VLGQAASLAPIPGEQATFDGDGVEVERSESNAGLCQRLALAQRLSAQFGIVDSCESPIGQYRGAHKLAWNLIAMGEAYRQLGHRSRAVSMHEEALAIAGVGGMKSIVKDDIVSTSM
jgi:hypothetical protein